MEKVSIKHVRSARRMITCYQLQSKFNVLFEPTVRLTFKLPCVSRSQWLHCSGTMIDELFFLLTPVVFTSIFSALKENGK